MKFFFIIFSLSICFFNPIEALTSNEELKDKTLELKAGIFEARKEYANAESLYREILHKTPNDTSIKLKLAEVLSWEKKYDESIVIYQELLDANPSDIQLRRKYGMVLMWMGKEEEAAKQIEGTLQ